MAARSRLEAALLFAAITPAAAGVVEVPIKLPVAQKVDTTGMERALVGGFRVSDHPTVDLDRELNQWLRSLLRKNTPFEVIDADALPLPEQSAEEAFRNAAYWKRLGQRFRAHLILGGTLDFSARDQSGFLQEDLVSETTGQRVRRSRWVEREGFKMELALCFFRGDSGELIYEDRFTEELAFEGRANDPLSVMHQLLGRASESILTIMTRRSRTETRYLFTE